MRRTGVGLLHRRSCGRVDDVAGDGDGAKRVCGCCERRDRCGAARCDGGSGEPGAHREDAVGRDRHAGCLRNRRPAPGRIRGHVQPARIRHRQAREHRAAVELHLHRQCRSEDRRRRRNRHRLGLLAGGRRPVEQQGAGAGPRGARFRAQRPYDSIGRAADCRCLAHRARRRRLAGDAADLLLSARFRRCGDVGPDGRFDRQRPAG